MVALVVLALAHLWNGAAYPQAGNPDNTELVKVLAFVAQKEMAANHVEQPAEVSLGLDTRLEVTEKSILTELRKEGVKLHPQSWCNSGPKGMAIDVGWPVKVSPVGQYEIRVAFDDLWPIQYEGAHFGTLVRRGTYVVRYEGGNEPEVIQYLQDWRVGIAGKEKVDEFCSSRTTAAYHSPQCDL
jgi:hypothetical protein